MCLNGIIFRDRNNVLVTIALTKKLSLCLKYKNSRLFAISLKLS